MSRVFCSKVGHAGPLHQVWGEVDLGNIHGTSEHTFVWFCLAIVMLTSLTNKFFRRKIVYFSEYIFLSLYGNNFSRLVNTWIYLTLFLGVLWWDVTTVHALRMEEMRGKKILILTHNFFKCECILSAVACTCCAFIIRSNIAVRPPTQRGSECRILCVLEVPD